MKAIVYESMSGYTEQYALALSKRIDVPAVRRAQCNLPSGSKILYMGWLRAGGVVGFEQAAKRYDVEALVAVGLSAPTQDDLMKLRQRYNFSKGPVLLLQGGLCLAKLKGINRLMMTLFTRSLARSLAKKPDKTDEERDMLALLQNGGSRVDLNKLAPIVQWALDKEAGRA